MVVLVAGAHGRLGQRIVALLLHRGHRVRALVRADAQADALRFGALTEAPGSGRVTTSIVRGQRLE
ncbi:MAG: NAD(P)H-binding protein, partial [Solirubrobacteraceae bacterium]